MRDLVRHRHVDAPTIGYNAEASLVEKVQLGRKPFFVRVELPTGARSARALAGRR